MQSRTVYRLYEIAAVAGAPTTIPALDSSQGSVCQVKWNGRLRASTEPRAKDEEETDLKIKIHLWYISRRRKRAHSTIYKAGTCSHASYASYSLSFRARSARGGLFYFLFFF